MELKKSNSLNSRQLKRKYNIDMKEVFEMCHNIKGEIESELMKVKNPKIKREITQALKLFDEIEREANVEDEQGLKVNIR
jgi:hypothetical protein